MKAIAERLLILPALAFLVCSVGCVETTRQEGSFDRALTATGPVDLEVVNGSGDVHVAPGPAGQVRVHGQFRVVGNAWDDTSRLAEEFRNSPPVEQQGNFVRIGRERERWRRVHVDYTITVPPETEVRVTNGSGDVAVRGVKGRALLRTGSGDIVAEDIGSDAEARAGSGDIRLRAIAGTAQVETGSGDFELGGVRGDVRAHTGSGEAKISDPGGRVTIETGSGDIEIRGVHADVRVQTGSGSVTLEGNPVAQSFWELETSSGDVQLNVPSNSSFTFVARTRSSRVETEIPLEITERSRNLLRGRVGKGDARITVETSSGHVVLR